MSKEKENLFKENKVYHFSPEGKLVPDNEADETSIKMVKIKPMTLEEIERLKNIKANKSELIFRPDQEYRKGIMGWIEKKLVRPRKDQTEHPRARRYLFIHVFLKNKMFKNGLKVMKKLTGKYLIKNIEEIPEKPYNNHLRIFYYCYQKALEDSFSGIPFNSKELRAEVSHMKFKSRPEYVKWMQDTKYWSYDNRMTAVGLLMMEFLEDTFDREVLNYMMIRMWHEMNKFYEGKVPIPGEFPVYTSRFANNEPYFARFKEDRWNKVWGPRLMVKDELEEDDPRRLKAEEDAKKCQKKQQKKTKKKKETI